MQVDSIRDALVQVDPANAGAYSDNAAAYKAELDRLDASISSKLSGCPDNAFVTMHGAFAYFAQKYSLEEIPVSGLAGDEEASGGRIAEVVSVMRERGLQMVFAAVGEDRRLADVIASEAGAAVGELHVLEADPGITYLEGMESNADKLAEALDCR